MAKLLEITGKAISGEWGQDDDTGTGIPVLRTTNFTNEGFVNYKNVVTRSISKKNIAEKYLRHGDVIIEKSGGSDKQPVGRVIFFEGEENTSLTISPDCFAFKTQKNGCLSMFSMPFIRIIAMVEREHLKTGQLGFIIYK